MASRMNLKNRLTAQFLAIGILPLLVLGFLANMVAQSALEDGYRESLSAIAETKRDGITRYFQSVEAELSILANDPRMIRASHEFGEAFRQLRPEAKLRDLDVGELRRNLLKFYNSNFAVEYKAKTQNQPKGVDSYIASLSDEAVVLQTEYIVRNANPSGSKHLLDRGQEKLSYSQVHAEYHSYLRDFASKFDFYDIFVIDLRTGSIVYSVFKEVDVGSNAGKGPMGKSSLGKAFQDLQKNPSSEVVVIGDFANYFASYEVPAAFIGTAISHNDRPSYALFFQLSIEKINKLMSQMAGLGKTGESFLVGPDFLMRSDTRLDTTNRSVVNSYLKPETGRVDTKATREAIAGRRGAGYMRNYANDEVLSAYTPIRIQNVKWALVAEVSKEEAQAAQRRLALILLAVLVITTALVTFVGASIGGSIAGPILKIAKDAGANSTEVGRAASDLLISSEQLSEMAEEQAESINETAASTDEIAAMVGNNLNQAEASTELSQEIKLTADKVDHSMEKLDGAMGEIRESNVQIQELVTVISEIAEKTAVIDEIVFQTKLLSFNASVEAERAGEHGRGFAVVAQEVGNLAKMSGKASVEITSMVKDSVKKAEKISKINSDKVALVGQLIGETEGLVSKISTDAERLLQQAQQILSSSKEQAEGIKQINEAMTQLEQATRQNSSAAHSTASASDQLKVQAVHLAQNVSSLLMIVSESPKGNQGIPNNSVERMRTDAETGARDNIRPLRGQRRKGSVDNSKKHEHKEPAFGHGHKLAVGSNYSESDSENEKKADSEWEKL